MHGVRVHGCTEPAAMICSWPWLGWAPLGWATLWLCVNAFTLPSARSGSAACGSGCVYGDTSPLSLAGWLAGWQPGSQAASQPALHPCSMQPASHQRVVTTLQPPPLNRASRGARRSAAALHNDDHRVHPLATQPPVHSARSTHPPRTYCVLRGGKHPRPRPDAYTRLTSHSALCSTQPYASANGCTHSS